MKNEWFCKSRLWRLGGALGVGLGLLTSALTPVQAQEVDAPAEKKKPSVKEGFSLLKKKKWAKAEAVFEALLQEDSANVNAYKGLGSSWLKRKEWDKAIEVYKRAQQNAPGWDKALYQLAYTYRKKGDYASAISFYDQFLEKSPQSPDAYYGLGQALRKDDKPARALAAFKKYIDLEKRPKEQKWVDRAREIVASLEKQVGANPAPEGDNDTAEASLPTGNLQELLRQGDRAFQEDNLTRASQLYRAAARKSAKGVDGLYKLGVVQALQGDLQGAIASWKQVLERDPGMKTAKDNIARAQKKLQEQAKKGIDDPRLAQGLEEQISLATSYLEEGRMSMALRVVDPMLDQNPEDARVRLLKGKTLMEMGRWKDAREQLELALGFDPGHEGVLLSLGEVYQQTNQGDRALYFFKRYLEVADPHGKLKRHEPTRRLVERLEASKDEIP